MDYHICKYQPIETLFQQSFTSIVTEESTTDGSLDLPSLKFIGDDGF